jgi:SOS response associated peptidase (SRAP)
MRGRFLNKLPVAEIARIFGTRNPLANYPARFNIAPTDPVLTVRFNPETKERSLDALRWGLVPHWAKDLKIGAKMINARAETVATMPAFRDAFATRRLAATESPRQRRTGSRTCDEETKLQPNPTKYLTHQLAAEGGQRHNVDLSTPLVASLGMQMSFGASVSDKSHARSDACIILLVKSLRKSSSSGCPLLITRPMLRPPIWRRYQDMSCWSSSSRMYVPSSMQDRTARSSDMEKRALSRYFQLPTNLFCISSSSERRE